MVTVAVLLQNVGGSRASIAAIELLPVAVGTNTTLRVSSNSRANLSFATAISHETSLKAMLSVGTLVMESKSLCSVKRCITKL